MKNLSVKNHMMTGISVICVEAIIADVGIDLMDDWTEKHFAHFWARMLGVYGKRWIDDHGSKANPSWRDVLKTMSFSQAAHTIEICLDSNDAHPITLSQFVFRARSVKRALHQDFDSLPAPEITKDQLMDRLEKFGNMAKAKVRIKITNNCSILKPGESYGDFQRKLIGCAGNDAMRQFIADRLTGNGCNLTDEKLNQSCKSLGVMA